jgi:hypothetical protein
MIAQLCAASGSAGCASISTAVMVNTITLSELGNVR